MAQESSFQDIQVSSSEIAIRKIGLSDLWQSLKEGYDDFNAMPSFGAFLLVIYPVSAFLFSLLLLSDSLLYLAVPIVAGFTFVGPAISVALFNISRRREQGLDLTWRSSFEFVHSASFAPIVALSILMMLLYVTWLILAQNLYFDRFGAAPPISIAEFINQLMTTKNGAALILYGNVVGLLFAFTALAISVVGFPLLLDKPVTSFTAVSVSMRAVTANLFVMAAWGLIVVVLLAIGALLLLVGLAVVLPVLGHATWHLYRKLVEP